MPQVIKISQLPSASNVSATDLMEISQDLQNGSYVSRKISIVDLTSSNVNSLSSNTYDAVLKKYSDTNYYATASDDYIRVEATSKGSYNIILPTSTGSGKIYIIKNVSKRNSSYNTNINIVVGDSDLIDKEFKSIKARFGECLHIIDGSSGNWDIISRG